MGIQSVDTGTTSRSERAAENKLSEHRQSNVSHSAPLLRGRHSREGDIVDAHKVRGRGIRGVDQGVSFKRRRRKHFLYEKKRRKDVWNRAAKCKQEGTLGSFHCGLECGEQYHSNSVCSISSRMLTFKRNKIGLEDKAVFKLTFTKPGDSINR